MISLCLLYLFFRPFSLNQTQTKLIVQILGIHLLFSTTTESKNLETFQLNSKEKIIRNFFTIASNR